MTFHSPYLSSTKALADLKALNALFIENFVRNDVDSHDAILHSRFLYINGNGSRIDRKTYLENWANGFDPSVIVYWDVRDELITIIGDVALVRATNKMILRDAGGDTASMAAYTDVYLHENDAWRCVQAQITPVAPSFEPGDDTIVSVYLHGIRQRPAKAQ
jgi:ketosteroid isomerase-like protein